MEILTSERSTLRGNVTEAYKCFEDELSKEEPNDYDIRTSFQSLKDKCDRLFVLDERISVIRFKMAREKAACPEAAPAKPVNCEKEQEFIEKYHDLCSEATVRFEDYVHAYEKSDKGSVASLNQDMIDLEGTTKLPKMKLPIFDGEIKNWPEFWNEFKKVHNNEQLTDDDKMSYLLESMKQGSEAIELFPPSGEHYHAAISYLKSKFGSEPDLVDILQDDELKRNEENLVCQSIQDSHYHADSIQRLIKENELRVHKEQIATLQKRVANQDLQITQLQGEVTRLRAQDAEAVRLAKNIQDLFLPEENRRNGLSNPE